jgi:ribonuclease PH
MNVVMTGAGKLVEISGGAERGTFSFEQMQAMIDAAQEALARVGATQEAALSR